jgi:hypothetical protein
MSLASYLLFASAVLTPPRSTGAVEADPLEHRVGDLGENLCQNPPDQQDHQEHHQFGDELGDIGPGVVDAALPVDSSGTRIRP